MNPIDPFLEQQGFALLDGGLSTQLERLGANLEGELWTSQVLLDRPDLVEKAHWQFLEGGADIIASATYQASVAGFRRAGLARGAAEALMKRSVEIAVRTRDEFWAREENRAGRLRPLVAASLGPYGACLHDGSEYHGRYELSRLELEAFHRQRIAILAGSEADLFAFETIPSRAEAETVFTVLSEFPGIRAWISFSCRDEGHVAHGEPFAECARLAAGSEQIVAVGVNCLPPVNVPALLDAAAGCGLPLAAYPNSGERWDAEAQQWRGQACDDMDVASWYRHGARLLGGCCRTDASDIQRMRSQLEDAV